MAIKINFWRSIFLCYWQQIFKSRFFLVFCVRHQSSGKKHFPLKFRGKTVQKRKQTIVKLISRPSSSFNLTDPMWVTRRNPAVSSILKFLRFTWCDKNNYGEKRVEINFNLDKKVSVIIWIKLKLREASFLIWNDEFQLKFGCVILKSLLKR